MTHESQAPSISDWLLSLKQELGLWESRENLRALSMPDERLLDFSSNDYLAMNDSPRLHDLLVRTLRNRPPQLGSTSSRLIRGNASTFEEAEARFSAFVHLPSSLYFGSGYSANLGTLQALLQPKDLVFVDRSAHASLLDGIRLSGARKIYFKHNNIDDLGRRLQDNNTSERKWIVTESVFSMDGDVCPLQEICHLARQHNALVFLDEAHSIGIYGQGRGLSAELGLSNEIAVHSFPCGKAMGLSGAFVSGSPAVRQYLINKARSFVFSTAPSPSIPALIPGILDFLESSEAQALRDHVKGLADKLRLRLTASGFQTGGSNTYIIPVIIGQAKRALALQSVLAEQGFDIRAIRPPTVPEGSSRLRISVHANHTQAMIERLAETLAESHAKLTMAAVAFELDA